LTTILGAILTALLFAAFGLLPFWPWSRRWGIVPSAVCAGTLLGLVLLLQTGLLI